MRDQRANKLWRRSLQRPWRIDETESPVHRGGREKKELDLSGPNIEEIKKNPYFDASLGGQTATGRNRISRKLVMNEKGKYIAQAAALRKVAALERMKRELAEKARKANLDEDNEKSVYRRTTSRCGMVG
jgi:U4/U6 small nuclear ribonucleoprotein PRP3